MKSFIFCAVQPMPDSLQFAYRAGKGVEDAKLFLLGKFNKPLELPQSRDGINSADFSSAFNTMQLHILLQKLI